MKMTYRKLMYIACGQSLALSRVKAYLIMFEDFLNRFADTDDFNEDNIRILVNNLIKETKKVTKSNNEIIEFVEELKG